MNELLERLRAELGDRYAIEHEVGRGGMAYVFLARDIRHDRRVALKVLRPDLEVVGAADRFLREIRTAAQLQHPHILPLYDSGTAGGYLFYVMPYVEGESVRQRIEREGPLPVDVALRIAREVADALDFAHRNGVIHRDIKPDNILLSAGHALVADFGIARAADVAGLKTETGLALGTPTYMSPEQATADPRVDGRSDQYALGCVVYEMLAGSPPFTGSTSQALMARHTKDPVPPVSSVRSVPASIEAAIHRALEKIPGDRYPTAGAFAESLSAREPVVTSRGRSSRVAAIAGGLIAIAAAAGIVIKMTSESAQAIPGASGAGLKSIAVLPFTFSGDSSRAVIADGMTEGLITGLVRVEGLRVPASDRVLSYKEKNEDPLAIGRELNVDAIVSAGVRVVGNRLRVTAQLVNVKDGVLLWRDAFDGELLVNGVPEDLFAIQDNMAGKIVDAIRPQLSAEAKAVVNQGIRTKDLEAYGLYQQARLIIINRTPENWRKIIPLLNRAIARDSTFADALLLLWEATYSYYGSSGHTPQEIRKRTKGILDRAIQIDSMNASALLRRAFERESLDWDFAGAAADRARARRLPATLDVLITNAFESAFRGERDSAIKFARAAWALDSQNPVAWGELAFNLYIAGDVAGAKPVYEQAVAMGNFPWTAYFTGMHMYFDLGDRAKADDAAEKYLTNGGYCCSQALAYASVYYRRSGNMKKAKLMLDSLLAMSRRQYVSASEIATGRLGVGDRDGALSALEQAVREHDQMLADNLWFTLAPLAGDPRYEAVRRQVYRDYPMNPWRFR
jgi:serine/threonine-protein kinase